VTGPQERQFVLVSSEFYPGDKPVDGVYEGDYDKMLSANPQYVVFNGVADQYKASPRQVKPDEKFRVWVANAGPTLTNAFHVIGTMFNETHDTGNPANTLYGLQTFNIPPGSGAMFEMQIPDGGMYPFVTHAFAYTGRGAVGVIQVTPDAPAAPDTRAVIVAYKRFLTEPYGTNGEVVPAQLRIARSTDGGSTWTRQGVDRDAAEEGDLVQQSVSIGGDGHGTIFAAYLVEGPNRGFRVAKSTDDGATWKRKTISTQDVGMYNAIDVVDADHAFLVAERQYPHEALRMFSTTDGGAHWSHTPPCRRSVGTWASTATAPGASG
jgi:hypothetical protein